MGKRLSVAQARVELADIVEEVATGSPIELTENGVTVAVLLSAGEYQRLSERAGEPTRRGNFWEAIQKFRREHDLEELWADGNPWEGVRDTSPDGGRDFHW
jgi:prevent-host-death family protein